MAIEKFHLHRRGLMSGAASVLLGGLAGMRIRPGHAARHGPEAPAVRLVSAVRIGQIDRGAVWGTDMFHDFPLPARAHHVVRVEKTNSALLVGRRPGKFSALVELSHRPHAPRIVTATAHHRFGGHAAVDEDGRIFTGEMHEETARGVIVLRDGGTGAARDAWSLGGVEPHDLVFARGGARLVVALGGIAHSALIKGPALNAGRIESALLEIDTASGRVLHRHRFPGMESLSLRHLALAPDGETVVFGAQDQDRSQLRPLVGVLHLGRGLELFPLPDGEDAALFRFYIGSVAVDAGGRIAAATSPKGGIVGFWSLESGEFLGGAKLADVCGLAAGAAPGTFWATSGLGDVVRLRAGPEGIFLDSQWRAPARFDNHLLRL